MINTPFVSFADSVTMLNFGLSTSSQRDFYSKHYDFFFDQRLLFISDGSDLLSSVEPTTINNITKPPYM